MERESRLRLAISHVTGYAAGCPKVATIAVVSDHPVAAESPRKGADAVHHPLNPGFGKSITVPIVEAGNDFVFQREIQRFGVSFICDAIIHVAGSLTDGEPIDPVVSLGPPAIKNAAIQTPIEYNLLAACTGCLQWPTGVIQPNIDALD